MTPVKSNKKLFLSLTAMAVLMVSGCSLTPSYQRPQNPVSQEWSQHDVSFSKDKQFTMEPFFTDTKINELIKLTMAGNKELQLSALNLKKAAAQYGVERLSALPNVSLTAAKTAAHEPAGLYDTIDSGAVTYQQFDVKLVSASWEIDFWGRLRSLREASLNEYLAADASSRALRISLMEQSVITYLTCLADHDAASISQEKLNNKLTLREMAHAAMLAGELPVDAVIDADKEVELAKSELAQNRLQAQQDYNALQLIVGSPLPDSLFINVSLDQNWRFPALKGGTPSDVLFRRPDIVAAEYQLKAANARIGAARAAFFPSVSITAEGGSSSAELGKLFSGGTASWNFVPSVNLPIFDGGKNRANLDIAELNKSAEIVNYQKTIQQAFRDVSDALAGQASLKQQYEQNNIVYSASMKQLQMGKETLAAGKLSKENLIIKENQMLDIKRKILNTRLRYLVQSVKLFSVLGGDSTI